MEALKIARQRRGISQRRLARLARISYKTIQLIESGSHDPRVSSLRSIAAALGLPPESLEGRLEILFSLPVDSIALVSERIALEGEGSWKIELFNFVDAFRSAPNGEEGRRLIETPPVEKTPPRIKSLIASTAEALCAEKGVSLPHWTRGTPGLEEPWFVSGVENLKSMALVESPVHFRKRNIFVLENFLERR